MRASNKKESLARIPKIDQQQVAEETGISVPFVSQLETAKRKASIDVMKKLASLLKVDIDDLV